MDFSSPAVVLHSHSNSITSLGALSAMSILLQCHLKKKIGLFLHPYYRLIFLTAISKFSEAIIDYIANIDKAPDPTVKKEMFSSEIFAAYDVIFNVWLQSKEVKVSYHHIIIIGFLINVQVQGHPPHPP